MEKIKMVYLGSEEIKAEIIKYPFTCAEILHEAYKNLSEHDKQSLVFTLTRDIELLKN